MMTPENQWTTGQIETLMRLWQAGARTADIGAAIGKNKNGVIGKAHRLGLAPRRRGTPRTNAARPMPLKPKKIIVGSRGSPSHVVFEKEYTPNNTALLDLKKQQCRWPLGDPLKPDFQWCGNDRMADCPYCEQHRQMAFSRKQPLEVAMVA